MGRLLLIVLGVVLLLATGLVLAANYLPWWGFALVLLGMLLALWGGLKLLSGRLLQGLFAAPFRAKGRVLHAAEAEVHAVRRAERPARVEPESNGNGEAESNGEVDAEGDEDDDDRDLAFFEIEVTIRPKVTAGPFHLWEPGELALVPAKARTSSLDDFPEGASIRRIEVFEENAYGPGSGMKYFGPQRLRLLVGIPEGFGRELAFLYYFEKFGTVALPTG